MDEMIPYLHEDDELSFLMKLRREFHRYPELGFSEFWTTSKICDYLSDLGYALIYGTELYTAESRKEIERVSDADRQNRAYQAAKERLHNHHWIKKMNGGYTGVIAHLEGKEKGPTIGFRFDIDALPIQESHEDSHLPFKKGFVSENSNMHACGYDGHIAIGLGIAKKIQEHHHVLKGDIYLIFQPAEEIPIGGLLFSKTGIIQQLDYFIPIHLGVINQRKIVCGLSFLASKRFDVTFLGKSAHSGASPETGKNALLAACHAVTALYGISRHSEGASRINVGKFVSDNVSNVIPNKAKFEISLRGESNTICTYLAEEAKRIIQGAAFMKDIEGTFEYRAETITAENSREMITRLKEASLKAGIRENAIIQERLISGSEDATFIMDAVQKKGGLSSFLCLGSPTYGGHHTPEFDFDEDMMLWGVKILWEFVKFTLLQTP